MSMYDMPMTQGRTLPTVCFRQIDLPEVKDMELNKSYFLVVKVKMTAKYDQRQSSEPQDLNKVEGDFQIVGVKAMTRDPINLEKLEQEDWEHTLAKAYQGEL